MYDDFGSGADELGDFIQANEASGWDGNWTPGEDFLGDYALTPVESFPVDGPGALGQAFAQEGSPNVGSPTEAEMRSVTRGNESAPSAPSQGASGKSLVSKIGSLFEDKNGELDINKLLKFGLGLGSFVNSLSQRKAANTSNQLQQQLQQQRNSTWTPQQAGWSAAYFQAPTNFDRQRVAASALPSPIVASRGYADGGSVRDTNIWAATRRRREQEAGTQDYTPQTLQAGTNRVVPEGKRVPVSDLVRSIPLLLKGLFDNESAEKPKDYAEGGEVMPDIFSGYVMGEGGGQSDVVSANLAPGEYVLDADVVSAVGDGSNEEGARILDEWREMVRKAKRGAPESDIPPSMEETGIQLPMPGAGEQ